LLDLGLHKLRPSFLPSTRQGFELGAVSVIGCAAVGGSLSILMSGM
jgi:hypothetical protein